MELNLVSDAAVPDEEELSVLEYARSHGICVNYETEPLPVTEINKPSTEVFERDFQNATDASITNAINVLIRERLTINRDAALFLKATHSLHEPPATDVSTMDRREWILGLKQELPLLKSDYELDQLNFGNAAMPSFRDLRIPLEIVIEQNDEGLEWPEKYFALPAQCDAQVKAEKLAISREVLVHLQHAIRDEYVPENSESIKAECLRYELNTATRPLSPPLLPLSPPTTPYIPSSPANRLLLASDSSDSVAAEAQALQLQIMAADSLTRENSDSSDSMLLDITKLPRSSPLYETPTLPSLKRSAEDLKVEGPLTPPMFTSSPAKKLKSVSFAETLHEYIPYEPWGDEDFGHNIQNDEVGSDAFLRDIEQLADQARKKVENEQLLGADTTARVKVPDIDCSLPVAPWEEYSQGKRGNHQPGNMELQVQMKFLLRIKRDDMKAVTTWHGLTTLTRQLNWEVFIPKVSAVKLEEELHGESEVNKILADITMGNIATSSALVWKCEGLRILDGEEQEEELEAEEDEERRDMEALIRKRKLELDEEATEKQPRRTISQQTPHTQVQQHRRTYEGHHWGVAAPDHDAPPKARSKMSGQGQSSQASVFRKKAPKMKEYGLMFGGFSATTALHKFMETRGKPVDPIRIDSRQTPSNPSSLPRTDTLPVRSRGSSSEIPAITAQSARSQQRDGDRQSQEQPPKAVPRLPIVPQNLAPCSFIVTSSLLQQRSLMKQVGQLYPGAELVYRDYNLRHSAAKEADIILSPSTGLIFTTLQQVKQRALPGQPDRSPIKERMNALQLRYERLVVMVGEGLTREMEELGSSRPDDPRDREALIHFETFASQRAGEMLVKYVRGGEQALARSTVVEMANYGLPHGSVDIGDINPLAVETSWEIFLRRTGLNPFAAQAIVAWLKDSVTVQLASSSSSPMLCHRPNMITVSGLPRFLAQNEEERVRDWQALMGGNRILKRVSKMLDQEWVSAAHGFRM